MITFSDGEKHISGNKCERGAGKKRKAEGYCLYEYKYDLLMKTNLIPEGKPKARIGIPMVLSYFEQLPLWSAFFTSLGFEVVISDESSRDMYYKGQQTIPSDTVCYPAKLVHGHIADLLEKNVDFIFYPCMSYNLEEADTDNHYNCPVVAYYPELLKANIPELNDSNFRNPYMDLNRREHSAEVMAGVLKDWNISRKDAAAALDRGFEALADFRRNISAKAQEIIAKAREEGKMIIVLAGRPYHIDKEINHGINKLITGLGMAVVTEDSVCELGNMPELEVLNQWTYHSRMYRAAEYVTQNKDMQLVQLVSFGCGIDAITTDEVRSVLEKSGKLYTQLKIDEISNLGAAKIRLRSLMAAAE